MEADKDTLSTILFVTGIILHKEGYKMEDIERILTSITDIAAGIFTGQLQITETGIVPVPVSNVVELDKSK